MVAYGKNWGGGNAVFARWTSEYDNDDYKDWWYIVHDTPYELENQKRSHKRKKKKDYLILNVKLLIHWNMQKEWQR